MFYKSLTGEERYRPQAVISLKVTEDYICLWINDENKVIKETGSEYEQQHYERNTISLLQIRFDNYFDMLKRIYPHVEEKVEYTKVLF